LRSTSESIRSHGLEGGVLRDGLIGEHTQREESEPFPIHFHAPGADVT
jgi:hypothetical protein